MKVAIAGYGQEGEVSLKYWQKLGAQVAVFDQKQPLQTVAAGVKTYFGEDAYSKMDGFDLIVRTPGLNPDKINTDGKIWSATNEFFDKCSVPIIGVTGTKGKGTTATLISMILKQAGFKTWLLGNIGVPALSVLEEIQNYKLTNFGTQSPIVVYELSSFQLWDLEKSPQIAVVLMIEPDHMDIHASMEEYVNAKSNITANQTENDLVVYHPTNQYSELIAQKSPGTKLKYMTTTGANIVVLNEAEGAKSIVINGNKICSTNEVGLIGEHNLENICAAVTTAWNYTQDIPAIKQTITGFTGLPHRLEFVRKLNGIKFYDDSIATNEGSVLAALASFEQPKVVIMGGAGKGTDASSLFSKLPQKAIKKLILLGELANSFAKLAQENGIDYEIVSGSMADVVQAAFNASDSGDVVLLSPAATSYDMFKNYKERGDHFKAAVKALK